MRYVDVLCILRPAAIVVRLSRLRALGALSCLLMAAFIGIGLRVGPVEAATCKETVVFRLISARGYGDVDSRFVFIR